MVVGYRCLEDGGQLTIRVADNYGPDRVVCNNECRRTGVIFRGHITDILYSEGPQSSTVVPYLGHVFPCRFFLMALQTRDKQSGRYGLCCADFKQHACTTQG